MNTDSADFIAKLRQIEEQANSVNAEIGPGLSGTRLQHIVVLAITLFPYTTLFRSRKSVV